MSGCNIGERIDRHCSNGSSIHHNILNLIASVGVMVNTWLAP